MPTNLSKALRNLGRSSDQLVKASRGSLGTYVINAPPEYGQPRPGVADVNGLISPQRMREVVMKTPTPASCRNTIIDFASGVPLVVRSVDPRKKVPEAKSTYLRSFMLRPNPIDTWRQWILQVETDLVTLGWAAVEIEPGESGKPANLWVLDGAKLWIDFDEHGQILGYDMMDAHGFPIHGTDGVHAWEPEEIIFFRLNPQTDSRYPSSRIQQLYPAALIENLILAFIGERFTDSNIPFGVYDIGDVTPGEIKNAVTMWNAQARQNHRVILTGSKGGKWFPFGYALRELEAKELLDRIRGFQMGVMGVTMNELGESESINKSNGYNLSYTFKKRAIEPLLGEIVDTLTRRFLYETLGWDDVEFAYDKRLLDARDDLIQSEIDDKRLRNGVTSINAVRNLAGEPSVSGGDEPLIFTGTAWVPLSLVHDYAEAQLKLLESAQATASAPQPTGSISAPEGMANDAGGSPSTAGTKVKPASKAGGSTKPTPAKASTSKPQPARGTVQTARNAGVRMKD